MRKMQGSQLLDVFIQDRKELLNSGYSLISAKEKLFEQAVDEVNGAFKPFTIKSYIKKV